MSRYDNELCVCGPWGGRVIMQPEQLLGTAWAYNCRWAPSLWPCGHRCNAAIARILKYPLHSRLLLRASQHLEGNASAAS
jgi:hypothetical protein